MQSVACGRVSVGASDTLGSASHSAVSVVAAAGSAQGVESNDSTSQTSVFLCSSLLLLYNQSLSALSALKLLR